MLRPADISARKDPQSAPSHADDRRAAPADLQLLSTTASLGAPDGAALKNKHPKNKLPEHDGLCRNQSCCAPLCVRASATAASAAVTDGAAGGEIRSTRRLFSGIHLSGRVSHAAVCVRVRACVRACVCVRVRVSVCVSVCECARARKHVRVCV